MLVELRYLYTDRTPHTVYGIRMRDFSVIGNNTNSRFTRSSTKTQQASEQASKQTNNQL